MSDSQDLVIKILGSIQDQIAGVRQDQAETNRRIDTLRAELSERIDDLSVRIDETHQYMAEVEVRLTTEIVEVASAIQQLNTTLSSPVRRTPQGQ